MLTHGAVLDAHSKVILMGLLDDVLFQGKRKNRKRGKKDRAKDQRRKRDEEKRRRREEYERHSQYYE